MLYDLAELFKMFADSTRVKILYALLESELCVCNIAQVLNLTQSAVSHQLRILEGGNYLEALSRADEDLKWEPHRKGSPPGVSLVTFCTSRKRPWIRGCGAPEKWRVCTANAR